MRAGEAIGAILVRRREPRPFSPRQIALLETFADQAVIAIQNVHLFCELGARTAELTRSVEQLTALGEVGRAVSSRWTSRPCSPPSWRARSSCPGSTAG